MSIDLNNTALLRTQAFINGRWQDASDQTTFDVLNPATGEKLISVANCGTGESEVAVTVAHQAMQTWQQLTAERRCAILEKMHDLLLENRDDLARLMTLEQGKPLADARGEVSYGASFLKWFAEEGKRVYGEILPAGSDRKHLVIKQPVGVVAAITPWNFPSAMIARKIAPALAVGCAVVLKPAPETPLSALAWGAIAEAAGLPAGLLNILPTADAPAVGQVLTKHPLVRKLTFTGSTAVGKLLMEQCASTMKRTSMELGGNAPLIVFDDADLDRAVSGAINSKYRNTGQTCISANRIMVQRGIYDAFVERFSAKVSTFKVGNGLDKGVTFGPLITEQALKNVDEKVQNAIAAGAHAVLGGAPDEQGAQFYQPTVLTHVNPEMRVFREEIFGPVAAIYPFDTEEEVIQLANDTEYGLAAYLYSNDLARIWRVSEAIEYGMVGVNETGIGAETIPFGGIKESGQGREGSKYGLEDYLETKYICLGGM